MWRKLWGTDLPVLLVQLPRNESYPADSWAYIREVQSLCATQLPRVATVVSFDEGDPKNLHPNNKYFIGSRLGLAARTLVYGDAVDRYCPLFNTATQNGSRMEVVFNHVGKGLQARGKLHGFELRERTGAWVAAEAQIASVPAPEAVRYAWGNSVPATLFNSEGLPASPFRSDTPAELLNHVKASLSSK
jgi:sialate O-acetylesterase